MAEQNRAGTIAGAGHAGRRIRPAVVAAAVLLLAAAAVAGGKVYAGYRHDRLVSEAIDTDAFYPGIVVGGADLGGKDMKAAKAAVEAALPPEESGAGLTLTYEGRSWSVPERDLGYRYNTDAVLGEAYSYARSGDREERYRLVEQLRTHPKTYALEKTLDETVLSAALDKIADGIDKKPQGPKVVSFDAKKLEFGFQDSVPGVSVIRETLLSSAKAALASGKKEVAVPASEIGPTESLAALKAHMKKLGSFSTVSKNSEDGTFNMARALAAADGARVGPGETFSFFGTVGECGKAQGYRPAGAILNGRLVQEYGGGICQASTTIYGAALRSDMTITERHNHSIPSSYCPIGLDATVSYPDLDFKFTNQKPYPVYLVTSVKSRVMTVTFYGYQPDGYDSIEVTSKVTATVQAPTKAQYTADPSLAKGAVKLDAAARTGYRAAAQRVYLKGGKTVKTEDLSSSYYRPQPAYYSYGKGTDLSGRTGTSSPASSKPASSKPASSAPARSSTPASSAPASSAGTSSAASQETAGEPETQGAAPVPALNDDVTAQGAPAA